MRYALLDTLAVSARFCLKTEKHSSTFLNLSVDYRTRPQALAPLFAQHPIRAKMTLSGYSNDALRNNPQKKNDRVPVCWLRALYLRLVPFSRKNNTRPWKDDLPVKCPLSWLRALNMESAERCHCVKLLADMLARKKNKRPFLGQNLCFSLLLVGRLARQFLQFLECLGCRSPRASKRYHLV